MYVIWFSKTTLILKKISTSRSRSLRLQLDRYLDVACSTAPMHVSWDILKLGTGMWTKQRKCWKIHWNGDQPINLRKFVGLVGLKFPARTNNIRNDNDRSFLLQGCMVDLLLIILKDLLTGWSCCWRWNWKIVQSQFPWPRWQECSYIETRITSKFFWWLSSYFLRI